MEEMEKDTERNMEAKVEKFKEKINIEFNEKIKVILYIYIIYTYIHSTFLFKI